MLKTITRATYADLLGFKVMGVCILGSRLEISWILFFFRKGLVPVDWQQGFYVEIAAAS